jgi:hypothetical protein
MRWRTHYYSTAVTGQGPKESDPLKKEIPTGSRYHRAMVTDGAVSWMGLKPADNQGTL